MNHTAAECLVAGEPAVNTDSITAASTAVVDPVTNSSIAEDAVLFDPDWDDIEDNDPANDDDDVDDPAIFPLRRLPEEIQDIILIDIAVGWRLTTDSFKKVYTSLAPVCKRWQQVLKNKKFFNEVKARVFKLDGLARYRHQSVRIPIEGIDQYQAGIEGAVILDTNLYLIESFELTDPILPIYNIFVYDLDFSDYNHDEINKRKIICRGRRELIIEGPDNRPVMLIASPAKNCLYFLARGSNAQRSEDFRKHVFHVSPDGAISYCLKANGGVQNMSGDKSGEHLVINNDGLISIYSTSTKQLTSSLKLDFFNKPIVTDEFFTKPSAKVLCFLSAALRDDLTLMTCVRETLNTVYLVLCTPTADGKSYEKSIERYYMNEYEFSLAADDNLCTMLMGSDLHVSGRMLERARKMDCYTEPGGEGFYRDIHMTVVTV